jgi:hypothetical protein
VLPRAPSFGRVRKAQMRAPSQSMKNKSNSLQYQFFLSFLPCCPPLSNSARSPRAQIFLHVRVTCVRQSAMFLVSSVSPTLCIARYMYFFRGHSPSPGGTIYLHFRHRDPSRDHPSVSRPVAGYNSYARTASIIGYFDIVGHYMYRFNIHPRVLIPLQGSRHRRALSLFLYAYCNFNTAHSPTYSNHCSGRSPLFERSSSQECNTTAPYHGVAVRL